MPRRSGLPAKHQCCAERDQGKPRALRKAQRFPEMIAVNPANTMRVMTSWIVLSSAGE